MPRPPVDSLGPLWYPQAVYTDLGLRKIRLLRLGRRARPDAPELPAEITCMMTEMSLDDPSDQLTYDAVSYSWGDWTEFKSITVNGQEIAVTRNLYEALLLFRQDYSVERWLWIDAICINQRNYDERERQVAMMGEIFRRANTVRVWLGPETENIDFFLDELAAFIPTPSLDIGSIEAPPNALLESHAFYDGLTDLANRAWWRRLWVVQEVTLASQVIAHCGNISLNFRLLVARLYIFWCSLLQMVAAPERSDGSRARPKGLSIARLTAFYNICGDFLPFISVFRRASDLSTEDINPRLVLEHLALISTMHVTVPRDRIYGLLGLLPRSLVFDIQIDYASRPENVYEISAAQIMSWSGSLDLLGLMELSPPEQHEEWHLLQLPTQVKRWIENLMMNRRTLTEHYQIESHLALPSWVPRWNQTSTLYNPSFWVTIFQASGDVPCLAVHHEPGQLRVRAYIVDSLFAIGRQCPSVSYAEQVSGTPRTDVIDTVQQWRNLHAIMSASSREEHQLIPFWRTLTMDRVFDEDLLSRRRWSKEDFLRALMFETWLRNPSALELFANVPTRNRIRSNIIGALAHRTFFTTAKKRIGIVQCSNERLHEGDVIALLAGLHTPAILRPHQQEESVMYEFIAACYTDGLMYAEALDWPEPETLFKEVIMI